jgi:hypothetical protein
MTMPRLLSSLKRQSRKRWLLLVLMVVQAALIAVIAWRKSVTNDELAHIPASVSYVQFQRFELYRVNPPLARYAVGVALTFAGCETDWSSFDPAPGRRPEWRVGDDFLRANQHRYLMLLFVARLALIPFAWIGTVVIWLWAEELAGSHAAMLAATLWVFEPNVLGNAALVTCDVPATAMGALAVWRLWKWFRSPDIASAYLAGVCLGLALLTKTVWIILPPLWGVCWLAQRLVSRQRHESGGPPPLASLGQLGVCLLTGLVTLNTGYAFEGLGRPLGSYDFVSQSLTSSETRWNSRQPYGNRFRGSLLAGIPVPLPESFVQGIDEQRFDFESARGGYMHGQFYEGGRWYYYVYGLLVKEPVGVLLLAACAAWFTLRAFLRKARPGDVRGGLMPGLHGLAILCLVSSQSGLNSFYRYLLPAFPFGIVVLSVIVMRQTAGFALRRAAIVTLALGAVVESLWVFPHSLSFFNIAVGGPVHGGRHLLGSNLDWGQDLSELERWQAAHPEATPLYLIHTNFGPLSLHNITSLQPDFANCRTRPANVSPTGPPAPGWYAISANYLYDTRDVRVQTPEGMCSVKPVYQEYFRSQPRVGYAGYSFHVFHVPTVDSK